jgi:xanthine dehydrogenase YagS FAD-binding subunit
VKAFTFVRPSNHVEASAAAAVKGAVLKAGGIDLLDRMKERIDEPDRVVALGSVDDAELNYGIGGSKGGNEAVLGALTTLAEIAASETIRRDLPALAEAAGLAASPQIRARATLAGNLLQHTRCGYYRHASFPCLKRGDKACPVLDDGAVQDTAAIFGNQACASANPSSLAPVLAAYGAEVEVRRADGDKPRRRLTMPQLYAPPERGRASDTTLAPGDVVVSVWIPRPEGRVAAYEEVRQKAAFDWALASCCVRLDVAGGKVTNAGVWLGSVAPTPWRAEAAEKALAGKSLDDDTIRAAAEASVAGATPLPGSAYKSDLVKAVVRRALVRLRSAK